MNLEELIKENDDRYKNLRVDGADWVESDYLNLDDIIASQTQVQCLLGQTTAKEVFPYCQLPNNTVIPPSGLKSTVNLWLINTLPNAELIVPPTYNLNTRHALHAGAAVFNFENDKRYFYELGKHLAEIVNDQRTDRAQQLIQMLMSAYLFRQKHIYKIVLDPEGRPKKLSELETRLYFIGQYSEQRFRSWWSNVAKEKQGYRKRYRRN